MRHYTRGKKAHSSSVSLFFFSKLFWSFVVYNGYNTCNIRCVGFFSYTKQFSLTSAVCATIYLSYDTVYLERAPDPTS